MAVHRPHLSGQQERPTRRYLGRVSLTIDDLDALVNILSDEGKENTIIEFSGGRIDEASDMKKLNDAELSEIRVKTPSVEVIFSPHEAVSIGPEEKCEAVYEEWARQRQTREKPHARTRRKNVLSRSLAALLTVSVLANMVVLTLQTMGFKITNPLLLGSFPIELAWPLYTLFLLALVPIWRIELRTPWSYAVIKPWTLEEVRSEEPANTRSKIAAIIATTSIVAATITAIALKLI